MVENPNPQQSLTLATDMKTCDEPGCSFNVFGTDKKTGKRYCKKHQHLRTDIQKGIRKTTLKERNKKLARNKYDFDPFQWGYENEFEMFNAVWDKSDRKSAISGRDLNMFWEANMERWVSCFAHVLNKKNFPLYRFNPENILLIHPYEHYLVDHGTIAERVEYMEHFPQADFNVFYGLQEVLKNGYNLITGQK